MSDDIHTRFDENRKGYLSALSAGYRRMIFHTWLGHPVASVLSICGLQQAAEEWHLWTLPQEKRSAARFTHGGWPMLLHDCVLAPWVTLLRGFRLWRLADVVHDALITEAAIACDACSYYPVCAFTQCNRVRENWPHPCPDYRPYDARHEERLQRLCSECLHTKACHERQADLELEALGIFPGPTAGGKEDA